VQYLHALRFRRQVSNSIAQAQIITQDQRFVAACTWPECDDAESVAATNWKAWRWPIQGSMASEVSRLFLVRPWLCMTQRSRHVTIFATTVTLNKEPMGCDAQLAQIGGCTGKNCPWAGLQAVVKVQHQRWGNCTCRFGPLSMTLCANFRSIVTIWGKERKV